MTGFSNSKGGGEEGRGGCKMAVCQYALFARATTMLAARPRLAKLNGTAKNGFGLDLTSWNCRRLSLQATVRPQLRRFQERLILAYHSFEENYSLQNLGRGSCYRINPSPRCLRPNFLEEARQILHQYR